MDFCGCRATTRPLSSLYEIRRRSPALGRAVGCGSAAILHAQEHIFHAGPHWPATPRGHSQSARRGEFHGAFLPAHPHAKERGGPMKMLRLASCLAVAAGVGGARVSRADEAASALARVRVEVQMVSVSVADARGLVPALQDRKTALEAFARVQEMLAQDKATLVG